MNTESKSMMMIIIIVIMPLFLSVISSGKLIAFFAWYSFHS